MTLPGIPAFITATKQELKDGMTLSIEDAILGGKKIKRYLTFIYLLQNYEEQIKFLLKVNTDV